MSKTPEDPMAVRIARVLSERILSGALPPGAALRQDHIATEMGASHVPVREAFRQLETLGLAVITPRRGARVSDLDAEDVQEVVAMRATLEVLALRHAAPNITRALLSAAERANLACETAASVTEWEAANRRFHRLLITPCQMPRLLATLDSLHLASARFLFSSWRTSWEAATDRDHRAILAALKRGQTEVACATLARHLGRIGR